jgi:hypothetical protein
MFVRIGGKSQKKNDPRELVLLARNNAAGNDKVRLRLGHPGADMAGNCQIVKLAILLMPH